MHGHRHAGRHRPHKLDALLRVHGDHDPEGRVRGGHAGAAEVDEEEVDGWVAGWDVGQVGDQERVAGYVDAVGGVEGVWLWGLG